MKPKHILALFIMLILAGALSACSGQAGVANSWPGIVSDGDTVYVAFGPRIYALEASTGAQKWQYPADKGNAKVTFYADPAISPDGTQLIAGSYDQNLYILNTANGQQIKTIPGAKSRYAASALVTEKGIFVANADKNLYALDLDGQERWKEPTGAESWAKPVAGYGCNCVYLPSLDHRVYAFNADDGTLLWKTDDLGGALVGTPALSEQGVLYVGTFSNEMIAIDSSNGQVIWRYTTEGEVWSGPTLVSDSLYFGDLKGYFYALNAANGEQVWKLNPDQLDGAITGSPLIVEDFIYFGTENGKLFARDTSGGKRWENEIGGKIYTSPVVDGDLILVAKMPTAQSPELVVAVSQDNQRRWAFTPPK